MAEILVTLIVIGGTVGIGMLTGVLKIKMLSKEERKQGKGGLFINGRKVFGGDK
ncbi:hypothetical protein [Bacillus phage vB_BanS-Thrax5]|nr:hypothetical protein [Bacillus phage vB_BanS-Thrax5]